MTNKKYKIKNTIDIKNQKKIFYKINKMITKKGIPYFLKKWKKPKFEFKDSSYEEFIDRLNSYVSSYHKHTFIMSNSISNKNFKTGKNKKSFNQRKPDFKFKDNTKTAYVKFYFYVGDIDDKFVSIVQKKIKSWLDKGMKKIVIDLSEHTGGNMWPVILGLKDIYGETTLAGFRKKKLSKNSKMWLNIKDGKIVNGKLKKSLDFKDDIVVIVSKATCSSGELIAVTFKGRERSTIVGIDKKTCGFMSINNSIKIDEDLTLNLTELLVTGINGEFYSDEVLNVDKVDKKVNNISKYLQ